MPEKGTKTNYISYYKSWYHNNVCVEESSIKDQKKNRPPKILFEIDISTK